MSQKHCLPFTQQIMNRTQAAWWKPPFKLLYYKSTTDKHFTKVDKVQILRQCFAFFFFFGEVKDMHKNEGVDTLWNITEFSTLGFWNNELNITLLMGFDQWSLGDFYFYGGESKALRVSLGQYISAVSLLIASIQAEPVSPKCGQSEQCHKSIVCLSLRVLTMGGTRGQQSHWF